MEDIRKKFKEANEKKEFWFNKKEELKKTLNEKIKHIKDFKSQKDNSNIEIQKLKEERDKLNKKVKLLVEKFKKLNKEKLNAYKKFKVKVEPEKIRSKINQLEEQIETETSFKKEKALMEEIKTLKKTYEEVAEVAEISKKVRKLDEEIKDYKSKADGFHKQIKDLMKDKNYSQFMGLSKEIVKIKKEQEDAFQKFIDYKNEYNKLGLVLKVSKPKKKRHKKTVVKTDNTQKKRNKELLKKKSKEVEEKLSKKKKLTTDDLIAFQGASDESL